MEAYELKAKCTWLNQTYYSYESHIITHVFRGKKLWKYRNDTTIMPQPRDECGSSMYLNMNNI